VLAHVCAILLLRHALDDHAREVECGVVIAPTSTRLELEWLVFDQPEYLFVRQFESLVVGCVGQRGEAVDARSMIKKLAHSDMMSLCRRLGHILRYVVVEPQLTFVNQLQDDRG